MARNFDKLDLPNDIPSLSNDELLDMEQVAWDFKEIYNEKYEMLRKARELRGIKNDS